MNEANSNRKVAIFALFAIVSTVSLASGIHDLVAKEGAAQAAGVDSTPSFSVDAAAKTNNQGDIAIEISYQGISTETLVFRVAMDSMKMDAPPLAEYDLARLAHLTGIGGSEIRPSRWSIEETGHMGHHVKGTLAFTLNPAHRALLERGPTSFDIVVADVGGAKRGVFSWKTAPGGR